MMFSIIYVSDLLLWLQDMTSKERQVQSTPSSPGVSLENEINKPRDLGTERDGEVGQRIVKQTQYYTMICFERRSADKIFEFLV